MKKHFNNLTLNSFAQNNSGNELTAEGIAKTKVKPDLVSLRIKVEKRNFVEKTSIKELNSRNKCNRLVKC